MKIIRGILCATLAGVFFFGLLFKMAGGILCCLADGLYGQLEE
jgi:hypothetical protein